MLTNPSSLTSLLAIICAVSVSYFTYALKCELKGLVNDRIQCILHDRGINPNVGGSRKMEKTSNIVEELMKQQNSTANEMWKYSAGLDRNSSFSKLTNEQNFKRHVVKVIPGTRWCGEAFGPSDLSYENLVLFVKTEKCCKQHESCQLSMEPRETENELSNLGLLPRYHCSCEMNFRACLKQVNSPAGNKIGFTYFNVFGPQCFKEEYPIVNCTRNKTSRCLAYKLDRKSNKKYQWFDVPLY